MLVIKLTSRVWTKNTMEVNGNRKCLVTNILQNIFYYVLQKKKKTVIQGWGWDLRVSKWWQNWHFWVDYPFKTYWWFQAQKCSRKILKMKKNVSCNPRTALSSFLKHVKNKKPQDIFFGWVKKIHVTKISVLACWKTQEKERVWASLTCGKGWISARVHAGGVCWSCRCITHRKSCCTGGKNNHSN